MPTDKPVINIIIDEELLKRIEEYRYSNHIPSRTEAIRKLIESGLACRCSRQEHPPGE